MKSTTLTQLDQDEDFLKWTPSRQINLQASAYSLFVVQRQATAMKKGTLVYFCEDQVDCLIPSTANAAIGDVVRHSSEEMEVWTVRKSRETLNGKLKHEMLEVRTSRLQLLQPSDCSTNARGLNLVLHWY